MLAGQTSIFDYLKSLEPQREEIPTLKLKPLKTANNEHHDYTTYDNKMRVESEREYENIRRKDKRLL